MKCVASVVVLLSLLALSSALPQYLLCDRTLLSDFSTTQCTGTDVTACRGQGDNVMGGLPIERTSLFNSAPSCIETDEQVTFQLGTLRAFHASDGTASGSNCPPSGPTRVFNQQGLGAVTYTAPPSAGPVVFLVVKAQGLSDPIEWQEFTVPIQAACPTPSPASTPPGPSAAPTCIAGDMMVKTPTGEKLVEEIKTGDIIATGKGAFEPVLFNGFHRTKDNKRSNIDVQTTYVEIGLEDGRTVMLSPTHFALTSKGEVPARSIKVGDIIEETRVLSTRLVSKMGAYSPQTKTRKILVNNVVVSTKTESDPAPEWVLDFGLTVLSAFYAVAPAAVYAGVVDSLTEYVVEPIYYGEVDGLENYVLPILAVIVIRKLVHKA